MTDSALAEPEVDHDHPLIESSTRPIRHFREGKMGVEAAIEKALGQAMENSGKLPESVLAIEGMSGKKYRYFINNLIEFLQSPRYLEVGSWAGSTMCSAIHGNQLTAIAVDNWSEFGGPMDRFFKNISENCSGETRLSVINRDFRQVDYASLGKFNVYLFDGPHSYADQYDGLAMAMDCLDEEFAFIVDDWNWEQVRNGTLTAIADLGLTIVSSTEIRTTIDNSHPTIAMQNSDWHNGYFISHLRK